jgi:hypothetical protein
MPSEEREDHPVLTQEMFDLFRVVDNGDGTQDEAKHDALRALHDAGVGKGDL